MQHLRSPVSDTYTPATGLSRALLRGAASALACEMAIDRGDGTSALFYLSDLREAVSEVERFAVIAPTESDLISDGEQIAVLRRAEQKLAGRYGELANRGQQTGADPIRGK